MFSKQKIVHLVVCGCFGWIPSIHAKHPMILLDKVIATVDQEHILYSDLEMWCAQLQLEGQTIDRDAKRNLLRDLVLNKIFVAKARIEGTTIPERYIQQQCDAWLKNCVQQLGSEEELVQYFQQSIEQIRQTLKRNIEESMLVAQVKQGLVQHIVATPAEAKAYFEALPLEKRLSYPTAFEICQLVIYPKTALVGLEESQRLLPPTQEAIDSARAELGHIREQILQGVLTIEEAIEQYSEDQDTRHRGGCITEKQIGDALPVLLCFADELDPEVYFAIERLNEGEITTPQYVVKHTKPGWRLLYLKRKVEAHAENFTQDYETIRHRLMQQKQQEAVQAWLATAQSSFFISFAPEYQ